MDIKEAREICERFATQHKVTFIEEGECGFGRECVGFSNGVGGNWIDHNPINLTTFERVAGLECEATYPPSGVNAYHKHECLAVLGRGDEAIIQLAQWVVSMESKGTVEVVEYENGATGLSVVIHGIMGRAVVVREAVAA